MKIKTFKKKRSNLYELTLDNNSKINLYDDIIIQYNLLITKEILDKDFQEILQENNKIESYNIALKYINSKLRTEKEIKKKLQNYNKESVTYTINRLKKEGYLNDQIYIKAYINDEINLKLIGPQKIIFNLKKLGFKEKDILEYLETFDDSIWLNKIDKYMTKKINTNHNLSSIMLKQKILTDLINRGFSKEMILSLLDNRDILDNEEIYLKEYHKLYKKLSSKYEGEGLEWQIKMQLHRKGFKE